MNAAKHKGSGRRCPTCGHPKSTVMDSREGPGELKRRRQCLECGFRWTTVETLCPDSLTPEQVTDLALTSLAAAAAVILKAQETIATRLAGTWASTEALAGEEGGASGTANGGGFDPAATRAAR